MIGNFVLARFAFLLRFLLPGVLLLGLAACMSPQRQGQALQDFARDPQQIARLSCFLALENPEATPVRMQVERLELLAGDTWLPLLEVPRMLDSTQLESGQIFIGAQNVPPGTYRRMRIRISQAEVLDSSGAYVERLQEPQWFEVDFVSGQGVAAEESKTLLLSWNLSESLAAGNRFRPALRARPASQQIWSDLVLVSCPEIDTVFILRADTNQVVFSFGVRGAPTYMAIDAGRGSRQLLVLCSRERLIKVVDLETYRVVEFFAVPLNDNPSYMALSPDGESLYLLDEQSGYLTRMDPDTGEVVARTFVGYRPSYFTFIEEQDLLAVALSLSQKVVLVSARDLQKAGEFSTGSAPAGLLALDNQLYVAEERGNSVSVIDLFSGSKQNRLAVGSGPRRLIADGQQIYVANASAGSLSVIETGAIGVVQEIGGIGQPGEMLLNRFYRRLYVTDAERDALVGVDANIDQIIHGIGLGGRPFGLAGVQ
jgi:hypothetical protein